MTSSSSESGSMSCHDAEDDSDLVSSESDVSVASSNSCDDTEQNAAAAHVIFVPWSEQSRDEPPKRNVVKKVSHATQFPTTERCMKDVSEPPRERLPHERLFRTDGSIDIEMLKNFLAAEGRLHVKDALLIVERATALLRRESNVLSIRSPVSISGDLHGQYYDLLKLLEVGGEPGKTNYLFLGDYVDRGNFSVEVMLLLYALKVEFPSAMFLIRGNHECRHLTEYFTFKLECVHKYDNTLYEAFLTSFHAMPLGAVVNNQFICLHGGLSPELKTVADIQAINRFREPPPTGLMCDIMWADPAADFIPEDSSIHFKPNEVRGCSFNFTYHAVAAFLDRNELLSLIRAHEAQDEGYKVLAPRKRTGFPSVITVFSAPNYLDNYNNRAAVLHFDGSELNVRQFNCSPHPYWLPNFTNAISWSIPFVAEKIAEMLYALLKSVNDEEEHLLRQKNMIEGKKPEDEKLDEGSSVTTRRITLRHKILSVVRFLGMLATLRNEAETVNRIKYLSPDSMLPRGVLLGGKMALEQSLCDFESAAKADSPNLRRPPLPDSMMPPTKQRHSLDNFSVDVPVDHASESNDDDDDDDEEKEQSLSGEDSKNGID